MFITLEGPDGAGKTTQAALLAEALRERGREVVAVHEPGGTDLGTHIRTLLLRRGGLPIDEMAEALLFSACRAQLVSEVIRPALARGAFVVADRFGDSTLAYQGAGRGLPMEDLESLIRIATHGLRPDLTLLLDLPAAVGLTRRLMVSQSTEVTSKPVFLDERQLPEEWNRFEDEGRGFLERVREAYLELARRDPGRWRLIDATESTDVVSSQILSAVGATIR